MITLDQAIKINELNDAFTKKYFETKEGTQVYIFNYDLASSKDFTEPFPGCTFDAFEMRGIIFVKYHDRVETFPLLKKFFGYDSSPSTLKKVLENKKIIASYEKLDGSLTGFIKIDGEVRARTSNDVSNSPGDIGKKESPVANMILEYYKNNPNLQQFVSKCFEDNLTAAFEYQSVDNKIIMEANVPVLTLIQVRNNTGEYLALDNFDYNPKVKNLGYSLEELLSKQKTEKNIEGWVVNFEGELVKFKTDWYEDLHDLAFEHRITSKTVLNAIINKNMDDVLSFLGKDHKDFEELNRINDEVIRHLNSEKSKIVDFVNTHKDDVLVSEKRKEIAKNLTKDTMYLLSISVRSKDTDLDELIAQHFAGFARNEKMASKIVKIGGKSL